MSEMAAKLTLTFDDRATPGMKAFMGLIEALGPKVTGLSNRLNTLEKSLDKVGTSATSTTTKMSAYDAGLDKTTQVTDKAAQATTNLESTLGALVGTFRSALQFAQNLAAEYRMLAKVTETLANQMTAAGGGIGTVNQQLATMQGRVNGITGALRGMAEMWAAQKLFKAGAASRDEASEFQMLEARLKALNFSDAENAEILRRSKETSEQMRFVSTRQAMEARIGAVTGIGRNTSELTDPQVNNIIEKTLPTALKAAVILQARGDKSEFKDVIFNLYGMAESRGLTSQPERMNETFDVLVRALASTGGKVTIRDVEAAFRNMKYGERSMISDEGMINIIAYINQLKAAGHGGGGSGGQGVTQAGTMATMMAKYAEGGVRNKEAINMLSTMGLFDPSAIGEDTSTTSVNTRAGGLKGASEIVRDPIGAMRDRFAPAFIKFAKDNPKMFFPGGKDPNDPAAMDEAITRILIMLTAGQGGQTVGQGIAIAALPGPSSQIQSENKMTKNAKDINKSLEDLQKTYAQNVKNFEGATANLALVIGTQLLPALTTFLDLGAKFIAFITEVAESSPATTQLTVFALAIGAVVLALSGINRIFGVWSMLTGMVTVGTTAATGFGAAWAGASGVIGSSLALISAGIRLVLPLVAAFLVGWDLGSLIGKFEVDGKSIVLWVSSFTNQIVGIFDRAWIRAKAFFGLIDEKQRDIQLRESLGRQERIEQAGGNTGGATTKWGDPVNSKGPYSETPEERLRRENDEKAAKLGAMKYKPTDKDANKRFFNPEAAEASNNARVAAAQEAADLRELDARYRALKISITDYYDKKEEVVRRDQKTIDDELNKKMVALQNPPKGKRDEAGIARLSADIQIQKIKERGELEVLESQRAKDLTDLKYKSMDAERQADSVSGHRHEAEIKRLNEELDKKKAVFAINGDTRGVAAIEASRVKGIAGIDYDETYRDLKAQLDAYKQKEEEVTDSVKAGTMTQVEAERQVWLMRREQGIIIDGVIEKLRELAAISGNEALVKQVGELTRTAKRDLSELSPEMLKIKGVFESSFEGMFKGLTSGAKSAKQIFKDFFNSILQGIDSIAAKATSEKLASLIFGNAAGGSSGGGGIFSWLTSQLGGSNTPAVGPVEPTGIFSWFKDIIPGFATGIDRVPRDMIAKIHEDETVLNVNEAAAYRADRAPSGQSIQHNEFNFNLSQPMDRRSQAQIATDVSNRINRATSRNS